MDAYHRRDYTNAEYYGKKSSQQAIGGIVIGTVLTLVVLVVGGIVIYLQVSSLNDN